MLSLALLALAAGAQAAQAGVLQLTTTTRGYCVTSYGAGCLCSVPTKTRTYLLPGGTSATTLSTTTRTQTITPGITTTVTTEQISTTTTVTITRGIVPAPDGFVPILGVGGGMRRRMEELANPPPTCGSSGCPASVLGRAAMAAPAPEPGAAQPPPGGYPAAVTCYELIQTIGIASGTLTVGPTTTLSTTTASVTTTNTVYTQTVYYVPPANQNDVTYAACNRDNIAHNVQRIDFDDFMQQFSFTTVTVPLNNNAYLCCVACVRRANCVASSLTFDGSTDCDLFISTSNTCPNPQQVLGTVRLDNGSGGYVSNGLCGRFDTRGP